MSARDLSPSTGEASSLPLADAATAEVLDAVFQDDGGLWVRDPFGNCRPFDIHDYESLRDECDAASPEQSLELRARAILLQRQLDAITGADIAHIRHSEGGIELAKRVVNLKNAADWLLHEVARALLPDEPRSGSAAPPESPPPGTPQNPTEGES